MRGARYSGRYVLSSIGSSRKYRSRQCQIAGTSRECWVIDHPHIGVVLRRQATRVTTGSTASCHASVLTKPLSRETSAVWFVHRQQQQADTPPSPAAAPPSWPTAFKTRERLGHHQAPDNGVRRIPLDWLCLFRRLCSDGVPVVGVWAATSTLRD